MNLTVGAVMLAGWVAAMPELLPSHDATTGPQCMVEQTSGGWLWTDCPPGRLGGFVPLGTASPPEQGKGTNP